MAMIGAAGVVLAAAATLVLVSLGNSMSYFAAPSDIVGKAVDPAQRWRLGGLVEKGSLAHEGASTITFSVTDTNKSIKVTYSGIVPDLFREGQGVVVEGAFKPGGTFVADNVLAKHDERYMPKEVADGLKAKGVWQPD